MQATSPVSFDFTQNPTLSDATKANKILTRTLQKTDAKIEVLVLRHTAVSGSAIMGTTELPSLEKLRVVDFSNTNASLTALDNLERFRHLEIACFNNCPRVILANFYPSNNNTLRALSLLGTRVFPGVAKHILQTFPKLTELSYTINSYDQKLLGLAPSEELARVSELSVKIRKIEGIWKAYPMDAEGAMITEGQTLYLHNHRLYTTPQNNASEITARLNPILDLDQDFILLPANTPHKIVDRGLAYQKEAEIRNQ